jgi:hypothetical protein
VESVDNLHLLRHLDVSLILNRLRVKVPALFFVDRFFVARKRLSLKFVRLYTIFVIYVEEYITIGKCTITFTNEIYEQE